MGRPFTPNWLVIIILLAHFSLGVFYSIATPIWEAYDEWGHYEFVRYVAKEHRLPPPGTKLIKWNDESHQPPLYYILSGLFTSWVNTSDNLRPVWNPFSVGRGGQGGMNLFLHLRVEGFPYRGTVLSIHTARLFSVLLSVVVVWATYLIGRILFPAREEIALGAMVVNAFWPQFLFNGSMVTNDIMVTTCSSLFLLFLIRILVVKFRASDVLGLGLCFGGALLSKRNSLALLPLALAGLAIVTIKEIRKIKAFWSLFFLLLDAGFISIWWFGVLQGKYPEHIRFIISLLSRPSSMGKLRWDVLPSALHYSFKTFWACFGWGIISVEGWVYTLVAAVCLMAGLGLVIFFIQAPDRLAAGGIIILMVNLLFVLSAPVYQVLRRGEGTWLHGRFILPAISSVSLLLFLGLSSLVSSRFSRVLVFLVGGVMFGYALLVPFRYIMPVYAKPELLSSADVQGLGHPLGLRFGEKIELLSYELDGEEVEVGGKVPVTLCWRCLNEMDRNYALAVKVLGRDHRVYGVLHLHPGRGNFPTSLWRRGDLFCETYRVSISSDTLVPRLAKIGVDFFVYGSDEGLKAFDAKGKPSDGTFGRLIIRPKRSPAVKNPIFYNLGGKVALIGYDLSGVLNQGKDGVKVKLYWRALSPMGKDYTVFVHLIDEDGKIKAQGDDQPVDGGSPTSIWRVGEIIEDEHFISLSPSEKCRCQVAVGMYDLQTMERLAVFDSNGVRLPGDEIVLGPVEFP